jgi:hypothetical protein
LTISSKRVAVALSLAALAFLLAHLAGYAYASLVPARYDWHSLGHRHWQLFNLNYERNLPSWFTASVLLLGAVAVVTTGLVDRTIGRAAVYWRGLAALFVYLSADEAAGLHERIGRVVGRVVHVSGFLGRYTWVLAGAVLVVTVIVVYLPFVRRLPHRTRRLFLTAGALYVAGAIGVELAGGALKTSYFPRSTIWFQLISVAEEGLEMAGAIVFLYAVLDYVSRPDGTLTVSVNPNPDRLPASS